MPSRKDFESMKLVEDCTVGNRTLSSVKGACESCLIHNCIRSLAYKHSYYYWKKRDEQKQENAGKRSIKPRAKKKNFIYVEDPTPEEFWDWKPIRDLSIEDRDVVFDSTFKFIELFEQKNSRRVAPTIKIMRAYINKWSKGIDDGSIDLSLDDYLSAQFGDKDVQKVRKNKTNKSTASRSTKRKKVSKRRRSKTTTKRKSSNNRKT